MRQLIARVDDELHRRLKTKASSENRSLNELVTEALWRVVDGPVDLRTVRQRARSSGVLVEVGQPDDVPSLDELEAETRGFGRNVGRALEADRGEW
ncbi:toxin-antitoxin system HicB family antitoxin [Actinopolyspora halophila]|uniref:toxin-antitoxin system HicB family antitoxin n=1 Tax=Actinopolyspora halophila TaxID=1850 RepID=UPI0003603117|nr:toxin-antitoxin system HicB family antitoxin [Actinopolyspora halophila]